MLSLLESQKCIVCGSLGDFLCKKCFEDIKFIKDLGHCPLCSLPYTSESYHICGECVKTKRPFEKIVSLVVYEGVGRELALLLKFHNVWKVVEIFDGLIDFDFDFDVVVPVPSYPSRAIERGFCASVSLAFWISKKFSKPICEALFKTSDTPSQFSLSAKERWKNVKGVFKARAKI